MRRIRWDWRPSPDWPSAWPQAAMLFASLYCNTHFYERYGHEFWLLYYLTPTRGALLLAAGALLPALYFVGPALACRRSRCGVLDVVEESVGSAPALAVRISMVVFLASAIGGYLLPALFVFTLPAFETQVSPVNPAFAAAVLAFLIITAMTSAHTAARLAWFTNKLGVALLVAALIRVRDGVPAALQALSDPPLASPAATWRTLSDVALYTAPLAFVAAGICRRLPGRGPVILAAVWGFAAPLCALLAIVGFIDIATARSSCYQPSLEPTPAMALFGKAAASSVSPRLLIAWVTVFPAVRLAIRVLAELASAPGLSRRTSVSGLAGALGIAVWFTLRPYSPITGDAVRASVACLAAAAAVVTSDFLFRRPPGRPAPRIDPVGATALTAGVAAALALPLLDPPDGYLNRWQLWLLPSYAIAFLVCASGRRRVH